MGITVDGKTDSKKQTLFSIIAHSPKGSVYPESYDVSTFIGNDGAMQLFLDEVIQEVGVKNVVQIITYANTSFMKSMGSQVMEKYKNVFWAVSASRCIERMLETFRKIRPIREVLEKAEIIKEFDKTLIKPSKITLIEPYFTLENIFAKKDMLRNMFVSRPDMSTSPDGIKVAELVGKNLFWAEAYMSLKASVPLVRTLQEIHESNEPQILRNIIKHSLLQSMTPQEYHQTLSVHPPNDPISHRNAANPVFTNSLQSEPPILHRNTPTLSSQTHYSRKPPFTTRESTFTPSPKSKFLAQN